MCILILYMRVVQIWPRIFIVSFKDVGVIFTVISWDGISTYMKGVSTIDSTAWCETHKTITDTVIKIPDHIWTTYVFLYIYNYFSSLSLTWFEIHIPLTSLWRYFSIQSGRIQTVSIVPKRNWNWKNYKTYCRHEISLKLQNKYSRHIYFWQISQ